jgi:DNA-nicking Smr family endonuclease
MIPDTFIEFYYGKYVELDLHHMTKEDAKAELVYALGRVDADIKCLVVVHGYHGGTIIKNLVRKEFSHPMIKEKVNLDAARTIYILKNGN